LAEQLPCQAPGVRVKIALDSIVDILPVRAPALGMLHERHQIGERRLVSRHSFCNPDHLHAGPVNTDTEFSKKSTQFSNMMSTDILVPNNPPLCTDMSLMFILSGWRASNGP